MPTDYNPPNPNRTAASPPPPPPPKKSMMWAYVAVGAIVLAIAALFAMPENQAGDSNTSGTPPAAVDTLPPPAVTDPAPATPN